MNVSNRAGQQNAQSREKKDGALTGLIILRQGMTGTLTSSTAHCNSSCSMRYMGGTICVGMLTIRSLKTNPTCCFFASAASSTGFCKRAES